MGQPALHKRSLLQLFAQTQRHHIPSMLPLGQSIKNQQGFTYLMVMFFVVMIGISLMTIGQQWSVTMKRDREAELYFRGTRIQHAIEQYAADHTVQKGTRPNKYPLTLKDLTKKPKRFLQTIYKDPMTGEDFELIKTKGEIRGVKSTSQDKPFDQINFKGAATYSSIRFEATGAASGTGDCRASLDSPFGDPSCQKNTPASPSGSTPESPTTPSSPNTPSNS